MFGSNTLLSEPSPCPLGIDWLVLIDVLIFPILAVLKVRKVVDQQPPFVGYPLLFRSMFLLDELQTCQVLFMGCLMPCEICKLTVEVV